MSNLIILLSNAYDECRNESNHSQKKIFTVPNWIKNNKILLIVLVVTLISAGIGVYRAINNKIDNLMKVSSIVYFVGIYLLNKFSEIKEIKTYPKKTKEYFKLINRFKNTLRNDFQIYSKEKLKVLIEECEKTIVKLSCNNNLLDKSIKIWKNAIFPLVTFGIGVILKLDNISTTITWTSIVKAIIVSILIILIIIISLFAIQSFINTITNGYRKRVEALKVILNDIYIKDYI
ncbi:hypothetical protein DVW07_12595 [Clostridium botulinum]|uniref:hypothetical protein n=1 Tax=Clostridium botulinum TaxID=1491 RepID=UPI0019676C1A|nr:hypothetical protein [Clostridium botulinum]MBN1042889.1 hypothetical protein [Clostridium botulinum]